jgi:purine-binding chemotaxis protein CheW
MNLADIRKKAESSRLSATVVAVKAPEEAEILPEMADSDAPGLAEPAWNDFELPMDDVNEEMRIDDAREVKSSFSLPETAADVEPLPEQLPDSDAVIATAREITKEMSNPILSGAVSLEKSSAGYSALETILAGRELATGSDDNASIQALAYASEEVEEYLCFRVAHEGYAISIMAIKEIVKPRDVTEVPRMPAFIIGVISLRGVIIPVMDMRLRLSLPVNPATGRERIIVLRMETGFCGVLVDEVIQVARIKKSAIEDPPAVLDGIDRDFVTGLGHFDNRMLIILNLGAILDIGVH